jgi:hypothetical protein
MRQIFEFGDERNKGFCIHCGGPIETLDHAPSKIFLDKPYPENLSQSPSCFGCNNGLSMDEQYLACLLECVIASAVDPDLIERPRIARVLRETPALARRLAGSRKETDGRFVWAPENERVSKVILKLAQAHAAFEYNEPRLEAPTAITFKPLISMDESERESFERGSLSSLAPWPEVGSRAMTRVVLGEYQEGWLVVQEGRYRFQISRDAGLTVRIVIREYLACEVTWD